MVNRWDVRAVLRLLAVFAVWAAPALGAGPEYAPSDITKVVILGTGVPDPDPARAGAAVAIVVNGEAYIVDAGTGVVRRAAAASPHYGGTVAGLWAKNLKRLFITHLHSDHLLGLPDLMMTPWNMGRADPLVIHGPEGIADVVENIQKAFRADRDIRLNGAQRATPGGWRAEVHEFAAGGVVYRDRNVTVEAVATVHGSWPNAYGYKFTTPDRVIMISGDTAFSRTILEASRGADILIHAVFGLEDFGRGRPHMQADLDRWKRYMTAFHTSTEDLARLANEARPGLLVLYHQIMWGGDSERLVREIKRTYSGHVVSASDLDIY